MWEDAQSCDPWDAAAALDLNRAVLHIREDPEVLLERWVLFIHFGTDNMKVLILVRPIK